MKILLITDLYPVDMSELTTPRTLYNFVKGWQGKGYDVQVLKPNFLLNSFIRKKPFYNTGAYGNVFNANYFLPFLGDVKQRVEKVFNYDYDIVIAHMPSGILFADKLGLPFIAGVHNSDMEVLTKPLYRFHFKPRLLKALRNAKGIACRSYVLKEKLLKLYPEFEGKTFAAPSGINENDIIDEFNHRIDKNNLKIVTCANFKKRKNIDKLIKACASFSGVELTVIGDGRERKKLERLDKKVRFTGRLSNLQALEVMRNSDVFILPSIGETFGMVYLEAMSQGCITVCTENDGIDGIIKNEVNGFSVKPEIYAIKDLLLKIKNLDNEKLTKIRLNSLNTVKQYTQAGCCNNYLDNIHKILFR